MTNAMFRRESEKAPISSTLQVAGRGHEPIRVERFVGRDDSIFVVYLHGGAWIMGSSRDHPERLQALADAGPTVLSIDYRLVTEAPFPAQREDVEAVCRELVPPEARLFLMGASAGAHLAALSAFTMEPRPSGFIGLFGRYDLTEAAAGIRPAAGTVVPNEVLAAQAPEAFATLTHYERLALLAGVEPDALTDERLAEVSPVQLLTADAPPILALHGTADGVIGHGHSERLVAAAQQLGVDARAVLVPRANHEDAAFAQPDVIAGIATFIAERSKSRISKE